MKKIITLSLILLSATAITITSCKKSKVQGCMDKLSINYNSSAEEDDGSCKYVGKATFWIDSTSAQHLNSSGVTKINMSLGGTLAGTYDFTQQFHPVSPTTCDESGYVSSSLSMGGSSLTNGVTWIVKNNANDTIISVGTVDLKAGTCKFIHITE